jgi:hypothetical protein
MPLGIRPLAGCRAVIGGKRNGYEVLDRQRPGEEAIMNDSRGADRTKLDGKPKIRVGVVRPAAAMRRRGRQDAALNGKKRKIDKSIVTDYDLVRGCYGTD